MKITALEEYGLRCLLQLAKDEFRGGSISEIAKREGMSIDYVSKITSVLKKAGLVEASRGVHGGYKLTRSPRDLKLSEISQALGSPLFGSQFCGEHRGKENVCVHEKNCSIRSVWDGVYRHITDLMDQISLADLLNQSERGTREQLLRIVQAQDNGEGKKVLGGKK